MSAVSAFVAGHKVLAALLGSLALAGAGTVAIAAPARVPVVTVARVIDGDTIDVSVDGQVRRVRLVNVVAPATRGDDSSVATCLGQEAADFLAERLPVGTRVRLHHGPLRRDAFGHELAAVYVEGELVNAAIAAAGLGVAERTEGSDQFLSEVEHAEAEARHAHRGLHDATVPCTLPAQLEQLEQEMAAVASIPLAGASPAALEEREARLAEASRVGQELQELLKGDSEAFPLSAYPTSVAAMRILVGVTNSTIAEERAEVRQAMGLESVPAAGASPMGGVNPDASGGSGSSEVNGHRGPTGPPAGAGGVEPRTGAPGAPTGGTGAADDAASAALEVQRRAAAEEAARRAAAQEAVRQAAAQETARQAAAQEAARQAAIQEEARRVVAEEEAQRAAALEAARVQEGARRRAAAAEEARRAAAEAAARRAEAAAQARRDQTLEVPAGATAGVTEHGVSASVGPQPGDAAAAFSQE